MTRSYGVAVLALGVLLGASPVLAQPGQAPGRLKLSFPGLIAGAGARSEDAATLAEFLHSRLVRLDVYEVSSASDVAALVGLERQKALAGCDLSCSVELAGAMDADRLLNGSLGKLGESWLLTLSLHDVRSGKALFRQSERFSGSLDKAFDAVEPMLAQLLERDAPAKARAEAALPAKATLPPSPTVWTVGLRVEADVPGLLDGQPAVAPALTGAWSRGLWGAAATVLLLPLPGVRVEGRLHFLEEQAVRPMVALGVTAFGLALAPHGAVGATFDVGPLRLGADLAAEYFVSGPSRFATLSVLVGVGAAGRF